MGLAFDVLQRKSPRKIFGNRSQAKHAMQKTEKKTKLMHSQLVFYNNYKIKFYCASSLAIFKDQKLRARDCIFEN